MKREAPRGLECVYALPQQDTSKGHRSFPGVAPLQPPFSCINLNDHFKTASPLCVSMLLWPARHQPRDADPRGEITLETSHTSPGFSGSGRRYRRSPAGRRTTRKRRCDSRGWSNPPGTLAESLDIDLEHFFPLKAFRMQRLFCIPGAVLWDCCSFNYSLILKDQRSQPSSAAFH